jgi:signal transduction histidine kinase/DNA-binding NarL/FixJ family response regulator/HPt (histidine-containing phosphotransfer) domain-containing protein
MGRLDSVVAEIRSEVCDTVLKWTALIGSIAVLLSLIRILEFGFLPVMAVHIALALLLMATYVMRRSIPYVWRAGVIVAVMFIVATAGHISFGTPARVEFYVAAGIMAAVFFGEKVGLLVVGACIATLAAIYTAFHFHLLATPIRLPIDSPTSWISNAASMLVAALAPLLAVNRYRRYLLVERERVITASRAKSDFLATMSHELRTPMTAILGMTDLLLQANLPAPERENVSRIGRAGRFLLDILNDILDFSKIEANKISLKPDTFDPRELLEEVRALFAPVAAQKGLRLDVTFDSAVPASLIADAARIRQVILNLVGNAVKFTERGGVAVRLANVGDQSARRIKIEVEDTGIGISPDQQAKLFQPFFQADQTGSRRFGGTGLGLSISGRLVELMGGTIEVRSTVGQGSTFTATFPVSAGIEVAPPVPNIERAVLHTRPLKLLVAEDNESIGFLMRTMLSKWGHDVDLVPDGKAALSAASTKYDVILMDMQMPFMDGATATREIRKRADESRNIPIIAVTADVVGDNAKAYLAAGVNLLISKPIDWSELAAALHRFSKWRTSGVTGSLAPQAPESPRRENENLDERILATLQTAVGDEVFGALMTSFRENVSELHLALVEAVNNADETATKRAAHSLKGLSSQFGAQKLAELAATIEASPAKANVVVTSLMDAIEELDGALAHSPYRPKPVRQPAF